MGIKTDRTGEENINNFGSEMIIVDYKRWDDIDVYFPQYNWTYKGARYETFKNGNIRCPYEPKVLNKGYLGEGRYKVSENGKITRVYQIWNDMLRRCYSEEYHKKHLTYIDCEVYKDWLNFQNFGKWDKENYYKINNETMNLDKDILVKHNKIYSPDTCIYVPQTINKLFIKCDKARGDSPIGTSTEHSKFRVRCHMINPETGKSKGENLGLYDTQEKAFEVYKYYKEKNIKQVADYYKGQIPQKLYNALYEYEVEITD